jgi:hypothetical protein
VDIASERAVRNADTEWAVAHNQGWRSLPRRSRGRRRKNRSGSFCTPPDRSAPGLLAEALSPSLAPESGHAKAQPAPRAGIWLAPCGVPGPTYPAGTNLDSLQWGSLAPFKSPLHALRPLAPGVAGRGTTGAM